MTQRPTDSRGENMGPLRPGEVRIFSLDARDPDLLARAYATLNSVERVRADAFRSDSWRSRTARLEFIAGRGWLRLLLAAILDDGVASGLEASLHAADLPIETGAHGKPSLSPAAGLPEFNVAHSRGQVMIALSQAGPVGIDLEFVDHAVEVLDIARASFAAVEIAAIERATPGPDQVDAFYRCWTAKEAIAKADGRGLSVALDSFSLVETDYGYRSKLLPRQTAEEEEYFARPLRAPAGYRAALATRSREVFCTGWRIETYDAGTRLTAMDVAPRPGSSPSGNFCPVTERAISMPSCGIAVETCTIYGYNRSLSTVGDPTHRSTQDGSSRWERKPRWQPWTTEYFRFFA